MSRALLALFLHGCSGAPEDTPPPPDPAAARSAAEALWEAPAQANGADAGAATDPPPTGEPVEVVLVWTGIGNLHRSFLSDPAAVAVLQQGLSGSVGAPANVHVRHDNENFIGQIRLQLRPGTRVLDVRHDGDTIQLQDLRPITKALAAYRSNVAGRFDLRLQSFHVGIESTRKATTCVFSVAGTPPPDGSVISPCVEITGREVCGTPVPDGVVFAPDAADDIRLCLDL